MTASLLVVLISILLKPAKAKVNKFYCENQVQDVEFCVCSLLLIKVNIGLPSPLRQVHSIFCLILHKVLACLCDIPTNHQCPAPSPSLRLCCLGRLQSVQGKCILSYSLTLQCLIFVRIEDYCQVYTHPIV